MSGVHDKVPFGSQGQPLQQEVVAPFALLINIAPGVALAVDVTDRWARQLGLVDLSRVLGAALTPANPVVTGIFDVAGNRMPAMDALNRSGFVRITDGTYILELDSVEPTMPVIEFEHHMVHEGISYTCDDYDDDVDTGAAKYWHIRTPDSAARIHIKITLISSLPGLAEFFENPTTTNDGVQLTVFNNDRNSGNTTTASIYRDPVATLDGTRIAVDHLGTNNPKTRFGGASREQAEWILKQNEQYLVKFTTEQDNAHLAIQMEFYEV